MGSGHEEVMAIRTGCKEWPTENPQQEAGDADLEGRERVPVNRSGILGQGRGKQKKRFFL